MSGHGIHLAANAVDDASPTGHAAEVAHFWDERFGHIWWHLGWLGLLFVFCFAERAAPASVPARPALLATAALVLGFSLFTSTVEGGTWWLPPGALAVAGPWALAVGRPVLRAIATAFAIDAVLLVAWAIWHGGVPQFSEVGFL